MILLSKAIVKSYILKFQSLNAYFKIQPKPTNSLPQVLLDNMSLTATERYLKFCKTILH